MKGRAPRQLTHREGARIDLGVDLVAGRGARHEQAQRAAGRVDLRAVGDDVLFAQGQEAPRAGGLDRDVAATRLDEEGALEDRRRDGAEVGDPAHGGVRGVRHGEPAAGGGGDGVGLGELGALGRPAVAAVAAGGAGDRDDRPQR